MSSKYSRPANTSLYVRNIHNDTRQEDLRKMFGQYGPISDVYIPLDYYTRVPRGFAYVQFDDIRDAEEALLDLDGTTLFGRQLEMQFADGNRKTPGQMRGKGDRGGERRGFFGGGDGYYRGRRRRSYSRSRSRSRSRSPRRRSYSRSPKRRHRHSRDGRPSRRSHKSRSNSRSRSRSASRSGSPVNGKSRSPSERSRSPSPRYTKSYSRSRSRSASSRGDDRE
eukprot:Seg3900.2 transcript_id=Seg3900.2/GoldUCD/mRNA.D3Y31 product="Serine/arginine-rich splicing factor 12" protein_id=Seg3900.2/GoldUCD/D3Y31